MGLSPCTESPVAIRRGPPPEGDRWDGQATFLLQLPGTLDSEDYRSIQSHKKYHQDVLLFQLTTSSPPSYLYRGAFEFIGGRVLNDHPPLLTIRLQSVAQIQQYHAQSQQTRENNAEAEHNSVQVDVNALFAIAEPEASSSLDPTPNKKRKREKNAPTPAPKQTTPPNKKNKNKKNNQNPPKPPQPKLNPPKQASHKPISFASSTPIRDDIDASWIDFATS